MAAHILIDGNNLLHAMHERAPIPQVGRETMVRVIERWARTGDDDITLIFDGPEPRGGMSQQMASSRIVVRFSAPRTADDLIVAQINRTHEPTQLRVVSDDTAIRHEARRRRCEDVTCAAFIREVFDSGREAGEGSITGPREKPSGLSDRETDEWLAIFGYGEDDDPLDEIDEMLQ